MLYKENYIMLFYLLGCTSIFLICQIIKTSRLIKKDDTHYKNCLNALKYDFSLENNIKICNYLNHRESFQDFVYNLIYTLLLIYVLVREIIKKKIFPKYYWILGHLSAIVFSLIGEIKEFQFSIDSKREYDSIQIIILITVGSVISILLIRQIYYLKINLKMIITFSLIYLIIYLIFLSASAQIIYHFHHAIICGLLSYCFIDFNSKFELVIHSTLMGIIIQGFNFYSLQEILMFYINEIKPPDLSYLMILYSIFLAICSLIYIIKKLFCKSKEINNQYTELLIPNFYSED